MPIQQNQKSHAYFASLPTLNGRSCGVESDWANKMLMRRLEKKTANMWGRLPCWDLSVLSIPSKFVLAAIWFLMAVLSPESTTVNKSRLCSAISSFNLLISSSCCKFDSSDVDRNGRAMPFTALKRTKPIPRVRNAFTVLIIASTTTKNASDMRGIMTIVLVFGAPEHGTKTTKLLLLSTGTANNDSDLKCRTIWNKFTFVKSILGRAIKMQETIRFLR